MTDSDWQVGYARSLAVLLNGDAIPTPNDFIVTTQLKPVLGL